MLVNQDQPRHGVTCSACARPLGSSYVRHVSTQRQYCEYDCYRRYQPDEHGKALALPAVSLISAVAIILAVLPLRGHMPD